MALGLTAILIFGSLGCQKHSDGNGHAHGEEKGEHEGEAHEVHGAEFQEGKGIVLPEETSKTLGVKIVEVTEGKISGEITVPVQVYRIENGLASASGTITKEQASELTTGNAVVLRRAKDGESISGKLVRIDQSSEKSSGVVEVVIEFPDKEGVAIGAFLQATLATRKEEEVVTIPREALLRTATGHSVYVVNGKHLFRTEVKAGEEINGMVEIREGLYSGDKVVLQPVMSLWLTELAAVRGGVGCTHGH